MEKLHKPFYYPRSTLHILHGTASVKLPEYKVERVQVPKSHKFMQHKRMAVTNFQQAANPNSAPERHNTLHRLRIAAEYIANEIYQDWLGDNGRLVCESPPKYKWLLKTLCKTPIRSPQLRA